MTHDIMKPQLCLIVVKTNNIEKSRIFYELLGLHFVLQKHAEGPEHYYTEDMGIPFELYPSQNSVNNHVAIGMKVQNITEIRQTLIQNGIECSEIDNTSYGRLFVTRDPDNNRVEIYDQLNAEEREILEAYEAGELKPLKDSKKRMDEYQ